MNSTASKLSIQFISIMEQKLATIGMHRVSKRESVFMSGEKGESRGWLGLNIYTHKQITTIAINPEIGIRHTEVEAIYAEIMPHIDNSIAPTVFFNIGYLTIFKNYKTWGINNERDIEPRAENIFSKIKSLGIPFIEKNSDLNSLYKIIQHKSYPSLSLLEAPYKLPIILLLLKRKDEAIALIEKELSKIGARTDKAADEYRSFAQKILYLINS